VTRAAGSLGAWDLVGIGSTDAVLCQVKTRDWPGTVTRRSRRSRHRRAAESSSTVGETGSDYRT
jgi:hypothetical protein